jgi:hypothetical protein
MTLTCDKQLDQIPSAKVMVPNGLGVGESVRMTVTQAPITESAESGAGKVVARTYWGSSETVPAGQPRVTKGSSPPETAREPDPRPVRAYWPVGYSGEKVAGPESKVSGRYTLTTNYCGGTSIALDNEQEFLGPVDLVGGANKVDITKPITVKWRAVPGALGYVVTAYGGREGESITWTSGSDPDLALEVENRALAPEEREDYLARGILLPPGVDSCTIPAGIFTDSTGVMLLVTAVGRDKVQTSLNIDTGVIVRSTLSVPLHIKSAK